MFIREETIMSAGDKTTLGLLVSDLCPNDVVRVETKGRTYEIRILDPGALTVKLWGKNVPETEGKIIGSAPGNARMYIKRPGEIVQGLSLVLELNKGALWSFAPTQKVWVNGLEVETEMVSV